MTTPADAPAPVLKFRDWMKWAIFVTGGFVFLGTVIYQVTTYKTAPKLAPIQQPTSRSQQQFGSDCTPERRCSLEVQSGGSTEIVSVNPGYAICFDSSFWENLPKLGYHTSRNGVERSYGCTREQVLTGICDQTKFDSFRFVPETGILVPRYWFVHEGTTQC
jgi:hypothetical protein